MNSQSSVDEEEGYLWFDSIVSAKNTNLYNGLIEVEKFRMGKEKHKFYHSQNFQLATLVYEEQAYPAVQLKYDLYEDIVLINAGNPIRLENDKINSFSIADIKFVKLSPSEINQSDMQGFFERLIDGSAFKLYKKHKKTKSDRLGNRRIYHDFKDDHRYYILYQDKFVNVENKKDIIDIFPKFKKQLNAYHKKTSGKQSTEERLLYLLKHVNELLSTEKTIE